MQMNLARKWRSKHFDELVGQPLVVRLVKNSLYRNLIFPVYLLSGTRGSGKTSVARIFAASLNCAELPAFQQDPLNKQFPCLACNSCKAMQTMSHPDFIEMDAASHTGVDNVRQIIEAASFVPALGTKKIYLIDEAHMLSKAAFNALLKILEEPPPSVVFMLATTDPHKIIDTVTSRCFHLFFDPIKPQIVVDHLASICKLENLSYESDALFLIATHTQGSMRDALNLIERLRIAYPHINKEAVIELLGSIDDDRLFELFTSVVQGPPQEILSACARLELKKYNPQTLWKKLVELIRVSLWLKNGVQLEERKNEQLISLVAAVSYEQLITLFELCYTYEQSFAKTAEPGSMLEMMLLKMHLSMGQNQTSAAQIQPKGPVIPKGQTGSPKPYRAGETLSSSANALPKVDTVAANLHQSSEGRETKTLEDAPVENRNENTEKELTTWQLCLREIEKLNDPLVISIFKQGVDEKYDAATGSLEIAFPQDLIFFKEWLENTKKLWQPLLNQFFGENAHLTAHFTQVSTKERPIKVSHAKVPPMAVPVTAMPTQPVQQVSKPVAPSISQQKNVSEKRAPAAKPLIPDKENWSKSHLLSQLFPGTLTMQEKEGA